MFLIAFFLLYALFRSSKRYPTETLGFKNMKQIVEGGGKKSIIDQLIVLGASAKQSAELSLP